MLLTADPGLAITLLSAPAGSPDDDALRLLASWAATRPTTPSTDVGQRIGPKHR